jgi:antitoxin component of RelBE/YafQ-DinJ toxin-antitoxin module
MAETPGIKLRLDPRSEHQLAELSRRLNLTRSGVVRLALARLAQAEGVEDTELPAKRAA